VLISLYHIQQPMQGAGPVLRKLFSFFSFSNFEDK